MPSSDTLALNRRLRALLAVLLSFTLFLCVSLSRLCAHVLQSALTHTGVHRAMHACTQLVYTHTHILVHAQTKNVIALSAGKSPSGGVEFLQRYTPPSVSSISLTPSFHSFSALSLSHPHFTLLPLLPVNKRATPPCRPALALKALTHTHSALRLHTPPHALLPLLSSVKPVHFSALIPPSFLLSFLSLSLSLPGSPPVYISLSRYPSRYHVTASWQTVKCIPSLF